MNNFTAARYTRQCEPVVVCFYEACEVCILAFVELCTTMERVRLPHYPRPLHRVTNQLKASLGCLSSWAVARRRTLLDVDREKIKALKEGLWERMPVPLRPLLTRIPVIVWQVLYAAVRTRDGEIVSGRSSFYGWPG